MLHRERGFFVGIKPFGVGYKALRPRAGECDNLLVPCCLSASHAAYGSVRMEPVFMMLGHAAGAAASLAIDHGTTVQNVPYPALRERLLADRQILDRAAIPARPKAAPEVVAPDDQLAADVKLLVEKKIIDAPGYWLANARPDSRCDGDRVEVLLIAMARTFGPAADRGEALRTLAERKVISSPAYWEERATAGRACGGDHVRAVIRNFARAAR